MASLPPSRRPTVLDTRVQRLAELDARQARAMASGRLARLMTTASIDTLATALAVSPPSEPCVVSSRA